MKINLVHKIGEGFFGEVWKAKWNQTQDIAVKKMKHEATNPNDVRTSPLFSWFLKFHFFPLEKYIFK